MQTTFTNQLSSKYKGWSSFVVSYRMNHNNIAIDFYRIMADNEQQAIIAAKEKYINDYWYGAIEGAKQAENMTFYIYKP